MKNTAGTVTIRNANLEADLPFLADLDRHLNGWREPEAVLREYREYRGRIYVAELGGRVLGLISLSPLLWDRVAMIDHLAVEEGWRRRGIGKTLVEHLFRKAVEASVRFLTVQTARWNKEAIAFYGVMGFSVRGIFPEYVGDGNDMVWLERDMRKASLPPRSPQGDSPTR